MVFKYDLFVSYARESEAIARQAYEHSVADQRVYFFPAVDRELEGKGEDAIEDALISAISKSREMLVILDSNHLAAEWCGWEIEEFRRWHGANAVVRYQAVDFSEPIHHPALTPWRPDGARRMNEAASAGGLLSIVIDPASWARFQGHPSGSFRLFDRWWPARRGKRVRRGMLREGRGAVLLVAAALMTLIVCALHFEQAPATLRQLALIGASCFGAGFITAVLQDVPVALMATVGGLWGSIAVTWAHALINEAEWDPWVAGGSATGIFLGLAMGGRLTQRATSAPRRWSWAANEWTSHRRELGNLCVRGALSVVTVLGVFRELFLRARLTDLMPAGEERVAAATLLDGFDRGWNHVSAPLIAGLALGSFLLWIAWRSSTLRGARAPVARNLLWLVVPGALGASIGEAVELSAGTSVGMLAGAVAAISVGRSRVQTQRARLSLEAAWPASLGIFVAFAIIGWWSTSGYQPTVSSSAGYGLTMGLLVALILGTAHCFHGAIWGRGERAGNDALLGGIAALCLLPVLGYTLARSRPDEVEVLKALAGLELPTRVYTAYYLSAGVSLVAHVMARSWLGAARVLRYCLSLSAGLHLTLGLSTLPTFRACQALGEADESSSVQPGPDDKPEQWSNGEAAPPPGDATFKSETEPREPSNSSPPGEDGPMNSYLAFKDLPEMDASRWAELEIVQPASTAPQLSFQIVRSVEERLDDVKSPMDQTVEAVRVACRAVREIHEQIQALTDEERTYALRRLLDMQRALEEARKACGRAKAGKHSVDQARAAIKASPLGDGHEDAVEAATEGAKLAVSAARDAKGAERRTMRDRRGAARDLAGKRASRNAARRGLRDAFGGMGYRGTATSRGAVIDICPGCRVTFKVKVDAGDGVRLSTHGAEADIDFDGKVFEGSSHASGATLRFDLGKAVRPNRRGWEVTASAINLGFEDRDDTDYDEPRFDLTVEDTWHDDDPCTPASILDPRNPGCSEAP